MLIEIAAIGKSDKYAGYNWIQTATTDHPINGEPMNKPFIDKPGGHKGNFYLTPEDVNNDGYQAELTRQGAASIFSDIPSRDPDDVPVNFHATVSLIGIKKNGKQDTLATASWGFTLSPNGKVTMDDVVGAK